MKLQFEHQNQSYTAEVELIQDQLWIHFQGRMFAAPREEASQFNKAGKTSRASGVVAPMPGKVTKLLKKVGDSVLTGDAVLVMEAMKMEYTLKSDRDGVLKEYFCNVGDQVPLGKNLAKIEA